MKRSISSPILLAVIFAAGGMRNLHAERGCSNATLNGAYGFYSNGTVLPARTPRVTVGREVYDGNGHLSNSFTVNDNGVTGNPERTSRLPRSQQRGFRGCGLQHPSRTERDPMLCVPPQVPRLQVSLPVCKHRLKQASESPCPIKQVISPDDFATTEQIICPAVCAHHSRYWVSGYPAANNRSDLPASAFRRGPI